MVSRFYKRVLQLYDKHPLLLNSVVGGSVYSLGEMIIQYQNSPTIEMKRVGEIGLLGSLENGILMLSWYKFLEKLFGNSNSSRIVLAKCLCDQIFFASQSDILFLSVCAYQQKEKLPEAVVQAKRAFFTTWLTDCSVWYGSTYSSKSAALSVCLSLCCCCCCCVTNPLQNLAYLLTKLITTYHPYLLPLNLYRVC